MAKMLPAFEAVPLGLQFTESVPYDVFQPLNKTEHFYDAATKVMVQQDIRNYLL